MPLAEITLRNFTVFADARLELCPGINVLIGANATGKTHAMKAAYAALRARNDTRPTDYEGKLCRVFRVDHQQIDSLRRQGAAADTIATLYFREPSGQTLELFVDGGFSESGAFGRAPALFIPSREVLSMFEGFIAAYQSRELAFDETFYDLCVALSAAPLRGARAEQAAPLLARLEALLGGKVILDGTRFHVQPAGGERIEAHLVAEGLRKLASIAHLVANGSIAPGSILFWDEPETNLNPRLIVRLTDVLVALAEAGVQVVLATHDYLLTHRLSLLAEYRRVAPDTLRFFSLTRPSTADPVTITAGATLAELPQNPILDEFARHYDFERALFDQDHGG